MEKAAHPERMIGGRFRVIAPQRTDVFGEVLSAVETTSHRAVTIRALAETVGIAPGSSTALLSLARGASAPRSPHLAELLDVICESGRWFLIHAAARGETLTNRVARRGPMPTVTALHLVLAIGDALGVLHESRAWHGRLDPTRVLVENDDAVVTELGLGILLGDEAAEWRTTMPDLEDPTVAFLSPEQAAGEGAPSEATDVWALGAILHYAVTGVPPYSARSRAALAAAARDAPRADGIDERVGVLIERCLAREAADRPSVAQVLESARAALSSSAPSALFGPEARSDGGSTPGAALSLFNEAGDISRPRRRGALFAALAVASITVAAFTVQRRAEPLDDSRATAAAKAEAPAHATTDEPVIVIEPPRSEEPASTAPSTTASASATTSAARAVPAKGAPGSPLTKPKDDPFHGVTNAGF